MFKEGKYENENSKNHSKNRLTRSGGDDDGKRICVHNKCSGDEKHLSSFCIFGCTGFRNCTADAADAIEIFL